MRNPEEPDKLIDGLRVQLGERLAAASWIWCDDCAREQRDERATTGVLGMFVCPLDGDFVGTATYEWEEEDDALLVTGAVGVICNPARELLIRLVGSEVAGVALIEPTASARVAQAPRLSAATMQLSGLVSTDLVQKLREMADIDVLIGLLRERSVLPFEGSAVDAQLMDIQNTEHAEAQLVPALLASAGRLQESRVALAEYEGRYSAVGWSPDEYRRFVRQLTRFLDAKGGLQLPTTPPRWPPDPFGSSVQPGFLQVFAEALPVGMARREAVDSVRAVSSGKTRSELRMLLREGTEQA